MITAAIRPSRIVFLVILDLVRSNLVFASPLEGLDAEGSTPAGRQGIMRRTNRIG